MSEGNKTKKIKPADGVKAALNEKAKRRRKQHQAVHEIAGHGPSCRNDLLPRLHVEYLSIEKLSPARRRVRRDDAAQLARIEASIRKNGVCRPVLVDRGYRIVDGHGVVEAARRIGLEQVPVIVIGHLSEPEVRLLKITLNRLGETGSWDEEALRLEFEDLIDLGEDVVLSGFEEAEIDLLLLDESDSGMDDEDELPDLAEIAVSQSGDLWILDKHRLLQGDALAPSSYQQLMEPGELARIVLTDEPYNVPNVGHVTSGKHHREFAMAAGEMTREEFTRFNHRWMQLCSTCLHDGGLLATFIDWRSIDLVMAVASELALEPLNVVVWTKANAGQGSLWRSQHELLPVFKKGKAPHVNNVKLGRYGRWRSNVWHYPGASSLGSDARAGLAFHPTVKPRALLEDALIDVTNRDEIVLDPFAGSGSTLVAAEAVGRICRAIEIDGRYCDVIIRRWQAMTGENAVLARTGETFAEVVARRLEGSDNGDGDDDPQI